MVNDAWHIPALHHSPGLAIWEGTCWILMAAADRSCNAQVRSEWWEEALRWLPLCYLFSCCTPFPARGLPSTLSDHVGSVWKLSGGFQIFFGRCNSLALYLSLFEAPAHCQREREIDSISSCAPRFSGVTTQPLTSSRRRSAMALPGSNMRVAFTRLYMLFYVISCCFMLFSSINQSINLSINQSYLSNHI